MTLLLANTTLVVAQRVFFIEDASQQAGQTAGLRKISVKTLVAQRETHHVLVVRKARQAMR